MFKQSPLPRTLRATRAAALQARGLATVADPPVRHYGGLKDQDRVFTNLLSTGDPVSVARIDSSVRRDVEMGVAWLSSPPIVPISNSARRSPPIYTR